MSSDHRFATETCAGSSRLSPLSGLKTKIELMRGGNKKVKSTQELLAELKNRKAEEHVVKSPPRRNSSSDSAESTNSTMRSTTATPVSLLVQPESPNDVSIVFRRRRRRRRRRLRSAIGDDNNEDDDDNDIDDEDDDDDTVIKELLAQVQPLDISAATMAIAAASAQPFPCTCRIVEAEPNDDNDDVAVMTTGPSVVSTLPPLPPPKTEKIGVATAVTVPSPPVSHVQPPSLATQSQKEIPAAAAVIVKRPIRSIFDLDYDEDDDPINNFKDDNVDAMMPPTTTTQSSMPSPIELQKQPNSLLEPMIQAVIEVEKKDIVPDFVDNVGTVQPFDTIKGPQLFPRFVVVEDEQCEARRHLDRSNITEFHLRELHNRWVPGVNGNWEHVRDHHNEVELCDGTISSPSVAKKHIEPDLYERVVPACNHICEDEIPKNLRHIRFQPEHYDFKRRLHGAISNDVGDCSYATRRHLNDNNQDARSSAAVANKTETEMLTDDDQNSKKANDFSSDVLMVEPVVSTVTDVPPLPPQRRRPTKRKGRRFNRYKIRKTTDFLRQDEQEATMPTTTKIILKLSRQLTNYTSDEEDEDDDEDAEDEEEYEDEDDEEYEVDAEVDENKNVNEEGYGEVEEDEENDNLEDVEAYDENDVQSILQQNQDELTVVDGNTEANNNRTVIPELLINNVENKIVQFDVNNDDDVPKNEKADEPQQETSTADNESQEMGRNYECLPADDNGQLPSFDRALDEDRHTATDGTRCRFREWHQVVHVKSYNNELLTILPYVVID